MKILHSFQNLSQVESDLPFCEVSPSHDIVQKATLVSPVRITRVVFWIHSCIRTEKKLKKLQTTAVTVAYRTYNTEDWGMKRRLHIKPPNHNIPNSLLWPFDTKILLNLQIKICQFDISTCSLLNIKLNILVNCSILLRYFQTAMKFLSSLFINHHKCPRKSAVKLHFADNLESTHISNTSM